jgi:hypothetical protein
MMQNSGDGVTSRTWVTLGQVRVPAASPSQRVWGAVGGDGRPREPAAWV